MMAGPNQQGKVLLAQALSMDDGQKAQGMWSQETTGQQAGGTAMALDAAFKLDAKINDVVEATFPFFGDVEAGQLSFQIGDKIKVLEINELWSWGKLERGGEEGWFPHNYVQSTFKPLPGMHELKQRLLIKKIREEARERGEDPDAAEAAFLNSSQPPPPPPEPEPVQDHSGYGYDQSGYDPNAYGNGQDMYGNGMGMNGMGMGGPPAPTVPLYGAGLDGLDPYGTGGYGGGGNGMQGGGSGSGGGGGGGEWSNINDVDMAFGMWMDYLHDEGDAEAPAQPEEPPPVKTSGDRDKRRAMRKSVARELMDTEDTYVRMLEALLGTVIRPTMGQGGNKSAPLPKEEANQLFGTLRAEEILAINSAFRDQLKARMAGLSDDTCFGDLFTRFAPFLKMYVEYCTQHESTASRVSITAVKNDRFRNLLARARADPRCQGLDAQSLLIMPIQRIPRYKLLLEEMLKNTDRDHADYKQLEKAIEQISDVASFINDSIKRRENQAKIWGIQELLSEPVDLAKPTRIYVKQGVLMKLGRYSDRQDFFALFNDGLLHARPATFGNKFIFRRLDPVLQVEDVGYLKGKPKANHPFRVVTAGHIFLVSAATGEEKAAWMRVLELTVRGGKRKLIHKGPLAVVHLAKDSTTVTEEYFYVFSDVVVRGKTLWSGKFKHKETLTIEHVEERFSQDLRYDAVGWEMSQHQGSLERMFRLIHSGHKGHGSTIVVAPSLTEKAKWLSALDHQRELRVRDEGKLKKIDARHTVVHQDNFADDSGDDEFADRRGKGKGGKASSSSSGSKSASKSSAATSKKQAPPRSGGSASGDRRGSAPTAPSSSSSRPTLSRGNSDTGMRGGSGGGRQQPLETVTDDLLLALDDSDDDVPGPTPPAPSGPGGRGNTQPLSRSSSQGSAGGGMGGGMGQQQGGGGKTHHLLDMDLARILGTNAPGAGPGVGGYPPGAGGRAAAGGFGGTYPAPQHAGQNAYATGQVYQAAPVPTTAAAMLPPPARDTPSFRQQISSPRIAQRRREYENMLSNPGQQAQAPPPQQQQPPQGYNYMTGPPPQAQYATQQQQMLQQQQAMAAQQQRMYGTARPPPQQPIQAAPVPQPLGGMPPQGNYNQYAYGTGNYQQHQGY